MMVVFGCDGLCWVVNMNDGEKLYKTRLRGSEMSAYTDFIASKQLKTVDAGFDYVCTHDWLFDYQKACVNWQQNAAKLHCF